MKKFKIFTAICMLAYVATFTGYGVFANELSPEERLFAANLEALSNSENDGWEDGMKTGDREVDGPDGPVTISCCVSSVPTDACNYDEVGCSATDF